MLLLEIFIIPGFGIAGIFSILLLVGGCVLAWTQLGTGPGLMTIIVSIVFAVLFLVFLPKTRAARKMILNQRHVEDTMSPDREELTKLIGKKGKAASTLRPSGVIEIDEKRYDVLTNGEYIEKGKDVVVVRVESNSIFVELSKDEPPKQLP